MSIKTLARYSLSAHYIDRSLERIFSGENEHNIVKKWSEYNTENYVIACTGITYGIVCNITNE